MIRLEMSLRLEMRPPMDEQTWLESENPEAMLEVIREGASDRKLRLFGCAYDRRYARSWYPHAPNERRSLYRAIRRAEEVADGIRLAERLAVSGHPRSWSILTADALVMAEATCIAANHDEGGDLYAAQLLRDLFGNPFQPREFDPAGWDSNVLALARTIYEDRLFDRLPILADALMDAGCPYNHPMIGHCHDKGPHVRGCWVIDTVLGRE